MITRIIAAPSSMKITPMDDKKRFRFRLEFREHEPPEAIEFALPAPQVMLILRDLQRLQVHHKIPIPENLRPEGRPALTVVETEE